MLKRSLSFLLNGSARFAFFFILTACIDPLSLKFERKEGLLVVDGMISNRQGPYSVRLSLANVAGINLRPLRAVTNASVKICDDLGFCEIMYEVAEGLYQTRQTQGVVGRTYFIDITTVDGNVYNSQPETILPPGELKQVYYELSDNLIDEFKVYADAVFPDSDSISFTKFYWTGTYEVEAFPQRKKTFYTYTDYFTKERITIVVPDPPACSGLDFLITPPYRDEGLDSMTVRRGDCECCQCWVNERPSIPVLQESTYLQEPLMNKILVTQVPIDRWTMYNQYVVWISVQSISRNAYRFWEAIRKQKLGVTDIFQPVIGSVPGNIHSKSGMKDNVLGIFYAASFSDSLSISFSKKMVPFNVIPIDTAAEDCRNAFKNSTNLKPSWW